MPSRANRAPGAAQQAITVSRSAFPNSATPPPTHDESSSDRSPTTTLAPSARSASGWPTRSTQMTTPKLPPILLAGGRAHPQTRPHVRVRDRELEHRPGRCRGRACRRDALARRPRRRLPFRSARRCPRPSGRHGRWCWRRRLRTQPDRRVRPGGSGPSPGRAAPRAHGSARAPTHSCGMPCPSIISLCDGSLGVPRGSTIPLEARNARTPSYLGLRPRTGCSRPRGRRHVIGVGGHHTRAQVLVEHRLPHGGVVLGVRGEHPVEAEQAIRDAVR